MDNKKIPLKYYLYFLLLLLFFLLLLFPYFQAFKWVCQEAESRSGFSLNWQEEHSTWFQSELSDFSLSKDGKTWFTLPRLKLQPAFAGVRLLNPAQDNFLDARLNLAGLSLSLKNFTLPADFQTLAGTGKVTGIMSYNFLTRKLNGHFQAQLNNTPLPLITGSLELKGKFTGNKTRINLNFDTLATGLSGTGSLKLTLRGGSWKDYPLSGNAEFKMAGTVMKYAFSGTAGAPAFTPEK